MLSNIIVPSGRADVHTGRRLWLANLPAHTAEPIRLMFEIMGWTVEPAPPDSDCPQAAPRLLMTGICAADDPSAGSEAIVSVTVNDATIAAIMAANGLDRLVVPVSLMALEQLMVVAG